VNQNYRYLSCLCKSVLENGLTGCTILLLFFFCGIETFAQTTIWTEDFTYANGTENGAGTGVSPANWTTTIAGKVWVQGNRIEATNLGTEGIWSTNTISINNYTGVTFSLNVATQSDSSQFEQGTDYFIGEYRIDSAASWTEFENASGDSNPSDPLQSSYTVNLPTTGTSLEIRIRFYNTANNEVYYIDDILVEGTPVSTYCAGELNYEFYDDVPSGGTVDNIPNTGALGVGQIVNFNVADLQNTVDSGNIDTYGIRYNGYIKIDTGGSYTFYTNSDDGSKLYVDGVQIVNNDGYHSTQERSGTVTLTSGLHRIQVLYFEGSGGHSLTLQYEGPSITKQNIPFSILYSDCMVTMVAIDTDGDGQYDNTDVDDDNDGILDVNECMNTSGLVDNGDFSYWIFNSPGWTGSGNQWNMDTGRAWFPQWNNVGTATFQQTIDVTAGTENSITFDLGADASYIDEVRLNIKIDGTTVFTETSTQIAANNGGNAANGNATLMDTRTFVFTPVGNTAVLSFDGVATTSNHDRMYVDNVVLSTGCTDFDGDGIPNQLDLDSDGDGIPDNVEGQSTAGYTAPANADSDNNGLDNAYETGGLGIPDTDGDGSPDFLDINSDDNWTNDTAEAGLTLSNTDTDNDGLDDNMDTTNGYGDPAGNIDNPLNTTGGSIDLPDADADAATGGDVDYRDDTDDTVYNQPPTLTATGNQLFCPRSTLPILETVNITDPDDADIDAVYVQISSGYDNTGDVLTLDNSGSHPNITATWDVSEGKLTLIGPALLTEFEAALQDVDFSSTATLNSGDIKNFSIVLDEANYLESTQHYYEYVPALGITWTAARDAAAARTFYGLQGYLATIGAQDEADLLGEQAPGAGWIGASDAAVENEWRWVTGPEAGTLFWQGLAAGTAFGYENWNSGEPNNSGNEDYAHITAPNVGAVGSWNDLSNTGASNGSYQPKGYLVEYGGTTGDPTSPSISASTSITVDNVAPTASNPSAITVYCSSDVPAADITVVTDEADNCTVNPKVTFISDDSDGGTNPEIITRTYRITDDGSNSIDVTQTINVSSAIISGQPTNQSVVVGNNGVFSVTTGNTDIYQWQVSTNGGASFNDLTNSVDYSGVQTTTLTIIKPNVDKNGFVFRVSVSNSGSISCTPIVSNEVILTTLVNTVITNSRITYRVKKN